MKDTRVTLALLSQVPGVPGALQLPVLGCGQALELHWCEEEQSKPVGICALGTLTSVTYHLAHGASLRHPHMVGPLAAIVGALGGVAGSKAPRVSSPRQSPRGWSSLPPW